MLNNDAILGAIAAGFILIIFVFRGMATRFFSAIDDQKKDNVELRARVAVLEKANETAAAELTASRDREDFERSAKNRAMLDAVNADGARQKAIAAAEALKLLNSELLSRIDAQAHAQAEAIDKAGKDQAELKQSFDDYKTASETTLASEIEKRVKAENDVSAMQAERDDARQELVEMKDQMQKQIDDLTRDMDILKNKTGDMPEKPPTGNLAGKPDTGSDAKKDKGDETSNRSDLPAGANPAGGSGGDAG